MPAIYFLKVSAVSFAIVLILVAAIVAMVTLPGFSSEPTLWLTKLDYEPEYYVEITPEELEDFPTLQGLNDKTAYGHMTELGTTRYEKNRIIDLLTQKKLEQDHPFEMWVRTTAWKMDEMPAIPVYIEMTAEELERFPSIEKAVNQPAKWCGISPGEWDSFQKFTQGYHDQNGIFIKFGDQFYQTRNTENIRSFIQNSESYLQIENEYYKFRIGLVG